VRPEWVERQLRRRGIRDPRVLAAMAGVPRELFVPADKRADAYADAALALSHGQTISQPYIVALICQSLEVEDGARVLDVGTGSGYHAAVLAELAAHVWSVERHPDLSHGAAEALAAADVDNVTLVVGDGGRGLPDEAPFDAINVAAAGARAALETLEGQLAEGGRLVAPLAGGGPSALRALGVSARRQRLAVGRRERGRVTWHHHEEVRFVPLVRDD
jgi:protein-L-isoaspartate(D-aspartate) O-methyltransferase